MGLRPLITDPRVRSLSSTKLGRAILTAFLVVTLVSVVAENLPDSSLRRLLSTFAQPYTNAVGLRQAWDLFVNPGDGQSSFYEARLVHADGGVTTWRFPRGGPLDVYWTERWRKLASYHGSRPELWEQTASWLARRESERGRPLKEVTLIIRWRDLNPPGVKPETGPWRSNAFYSWRPPSTRLRGVLRGGSR
jgi:hypothetical protein